MGGGEREKLASKSGEEDNQAIARVPAPLECFGGLRAARVLSSPVIVVLNAKPRPVKHEERKQ